MAAAVRRTGRRAAPGVVQAKAMKSTTSACLTPLPKIPSPHGAGPWVRTVPGQRDPVDRVDKREGQATAVQLWRAELRGPCRGTTVQGQGDLQAAVEPSGGFDQRRGPAGGNQGRPGGGMGGPAGGGSGAPAAVAGLTSAAAPVVVAVAVDALASSAGRGKA
jgi:hypothetical protein